MSTSVTLSRDSNQALGLGQFAIDFLGGMGQPGVVPVHRVKQFHADSVLCGLSALALGTNAPTVLRQEALGYPSASGAKVFGSSERVMAEKAVLANSAAVREWDSNGTNFGFRPELGHTAGEFGHNDFYPAAVAACQQRDLTGRQAVLGMLLVDEIRGRLAEVFSLKTYKIDHVLHGAIASAATYGALMGATAEQIEGAIGMVVAHYTPWRAIRAGKQLSDSKGASAAISTEAAILSVKRSMAGFRGPRDIFRNPEAIFRYFEPTTHGTERWKEHGDAPFDLVLTHSGDDFAVMGMHFKLGLYEHQSAGALQGAINLIGEHPALIADGGANIEGITIRAYEPAFGIIGNPSKKNPTTRQSADHSMAFIVATLLRKAIEAGSVPTGGGSGDEAWQALMLSPYDYEVSDRGVFHPLTRALMERIDFQHGGREYDARYPDGIPTSVVIRSNGRELDSGLVMYPAGHARNTSANLDGILQFKWRLLGEIAFEKTTPDTVIGRLMELDTADADDMGTIYDVPFAARPYAD